MFLISKLEDISIRFPKDVQGTRAFLLDRGIPATTPDALNHFSARLAIDPSFRRDVTSIVQAVIRRENEAVDYMDLLAILVVAATGEGSLVPHDSQEAVREILRFLTHIREPASPEGVATIEAVFIPLQHVEPVVATANRVVETSMPLFTRESHEPDVRPLSPSPRFSVEEVSGSPWWQSRAWMVGAAALLVGLGSGWLLHRKTSPEPHAAASPKSVASASLAEEKEMATEPRDTSRSRKPEALVARKASPAYTRYEDNSAVPAAVAVAEPSASSRVPRTSDPVPNSSTALSPRAPASAAVVSVSPRSQPLTVGPENSTSISPPINTAPVPSPGGRRRLLKVPILRLGEPRRSTSGVGSLNPAAPGVVHPGSAGMMAANLISSPAPAYPAEAFQARVQGEVTVRAVVDREGNITDARVVSGPELLRGAALEAVQHWRYRPYMQDGKPIEVATTAIVDFELP